MGETSLVRTDAVLETMWDKSGNEIPMKRFPVVVQLMFANRGRAPRVL
jgi:hypothetical protein